MISKLHYIIPDIDSFHNEDWYKKVCGSGIDWIQLRWKTISDDEFISRVEEVKRWTAQFDVKLVVNDRIQLNDRIEVDGFHLGKKDESLSTGRKLAEGKILGGTTNRLEDIELAGKAGVDYVGLGPYKFTRTKENLDPVLGYLGYLNIIRSLENDMPDTSTPLSDLESGNPPIIAIGNIKTKDVLPLLKIGVHGVAVSSYFNENTEARIKDMLNEIELSKIDG
jgi:thiamine-phosphate pyrophosphorylase